VTAEREPLLAGIAAILGLPSVRDSDNFFDLGGDSLAAVEIVELLGQATGASIDPDMLFEARTFGELLQKLTHD
jgi:acyl carrier protein